MEFNNSDCSGGNNCSVSMVTAVFEIIAVELMRTAVVEMQFINGDRSG